MRNGWLDNGTDEDRRNTLADIAAQRWADVDAGEPKLLGPGKPYRHGARGIGFSGGRPVGNRTGRTGSPGGRHGRTVHGRVGVG